MVLVNQQVKHNKFGFGVVTSMQGKYFTVKFSDVEKNFVYPDAFERYLTLQDGTVSDDILADLEVTKSAKEKLIEKKHMETLHSMTHGIVIPGKETNLDNEEEERNYKPNEAEEV